MWRQKLLARILQINYYNGLFIAVLVSPIDFNTWQLHPSRIYTIYCALLHSSFVVLIPATYTSYMYDRSYMSDLPVLQWVYTVTNASRILAIVTFIGSFWILRSTIIGWSKCVKIFRRRFRHRLRNTMLGNMQIKRNIDIFMLIKYCSTNINTLLVANIFYRITLVQEDGFFRTVIISTLFSLFLSTIADQICNLLMQLKLQFECINQSLLGVILQLKALDRAITQGASELGVRHRARNLERDVTELNGMHHQCYRIARRFLTLWQLGACSITLKLTLTNIYNLYHAYLFNSRSLKIDILTYLNGLLLTVAFYVDTILIIKGLDCMIISGNKPGEMLHECGDLLQLRRCLQGKLAQSLEQFSLELTCRHLRYNVCGLFNLDRRMGLKCFVLAIVQVTVIMQYDLKSKIRVK